MRETQRKYVEVWVKQLRCSTRARSLKEARAGVHAAFGLLNSTPHSAFLAPDEMRALCSSGTGSQGAHPCVTATPVSSLADDRHVVGVDLEKPIQRADEG